MNEYLFAFYIFLLICGVIILVKFLFSDTKRQQLLLEEKESKLLRLYQTLEDVMDEFYDSVEVSSAEMKDTLDKVRMGAAEVEAKVSAYMAETATTPPKSSSSKTASSKIEKVVEPPFQPLVSSEKQDTLDTDAKITRTDSILELNRQGKDRSDIAKELNITLSEVDLVIGINRK